MLKTIKHKAIKLLMFIALAVLLCAIGALIVWLYRHGSSAAFQLATGLLVFSLYWAFWGSILIIQRRKGGAA